MKKRAKKYDKPLALKEGVEWGDLINVALKPETVKKNDANRKRASGKKK